MSSGPRFTTSVDLSDYDLAVLRYVQDLHIEGPKVVRMSGRLLAEELIRITPPRTLSQGRQAVADDIGRAAWAIDPSKIHNKVLRQAVQDQEFDVVQAFLTSIRNKGGMLSNYRLEHFSPSLHTSKRNRRGRVRRSQRVIVLERAEHKRYVKLIQGHVGSTKYTWGRGAQLFGSSVPDWITRHHSGLGTIEDNLADKDEPNVVMTNKAPGIDSVSTSVIQRAIDRRERAMTADVDRILVGGASRYFD